MSLKKEGAVSDDGGDITESGPEINLRAVGGCPFGTRLKSALNSNE
ncbi:MAG: hypothetical protein QTN59_00345 [Candidatus Electrothrix communis]|nr:MAG: hypothetical protein QTN59_00345 [Candidatus Electrothrix communis]